MSEEDLKYFKLAKELNIKYHNCLLTKQLHFRGNFKSFSIISVKQDSPERGKGGFRSKEKAESYLKEIDPKELTKACRRTEEKNLQAFIINYARNNEGVLPFGDFTFVTSEMAVKLDDGKKIVNDILALDSNNNLVIIELKSIRNNKVKQQAIDFEEKVIIPKRSLIEEIVKLITDKTWSGTIRKIAIWKAPTSKTSVKLNSLTDNVELYNYVFEGKKSKNYVTMDKVIFEKE